MGQRYRDMILLTGFLFFEVLTLSTEDVSFILAFGVSEPPSMAAKGIIHERKKPLP